MIFVTLGSQKFQFDRLLKRIDELIDKKLINETLFAQSGYSEYQPRNYNYKQFLDRDEFTKLMNNSDVIITHGGTGAIIGAVKAEKKVIAVPRLAKYGEHVDDHQLQIVKQFDEMGIIIACYDLNDLDKCIEKANSITLRKYQSNTDNIIKSIEKFIKSIYGEDDND